MTTPFSAIVRTLPPSTAPGHPRRRDARRSFDALTAAASEAFLTEGLDVPVDEIARRAGVGVATLYRHFPTKVDLIEAVTGVVLDQLVAATVEVLERSEPGQVLERFLTVVMAQQHANRGFVQALAQHGMSDAVRSRLANRVLKMLEPVVAVSHASATLDLDLDANDLLVVMRMAGAAATDPRTEARPADRYVNVLVRGLAPRRT